MQSRNNQQGIAIIIVIAIMVALIMITTALLGTVTRMGDAAKSYKFASMTKLAALSARAEIIGKGDTLKVNASTDNFNFSSDYESTTAIYYDQNLNYKGTADDFYKLMCKYYVIDSGINLSYLKKATKENERKVLSNLTENISEIGMNGTSKQFFGYAKTFNNAAKQYMPDALKSTDTLYTFNDAAQKVSPQNLWANGLPYCLFGETTSPVKYNYKTVPPVIIASMVGNYRIDPYKDDADTTIEIPKLDSIAKKIIDQQATASLTAIRDSLYDNETSGYKTGVTAADNLDAAKLNAAIEKLVFSLFGSGSKTDYVAIPGTEYTGEHFTGRLCEAKDVRFFRAIIKAELTNTVKEEVVASRYYEFVYDKTKKQVVYSHWFEME